MLMTREALLVELRRHLNLTEDMVSDEILLQGSEGTSLRALIEFCYAKDALIFEIKSHVRQVFTDISAKIRR